MQFAQHNVDLSTPRVMGILNVTPDSFSDGGQFQNLDAALKQAETLIAEGADFLDIGGESTRPGATPVTLEQELARVIPVIEAINQRFDTLISVDTSKAEVMAQAVEAGAVLINDVRALTSEGALAVAAKANVPVCLMHMLGTPETMQNAPSYHQVTDQVALYLQGRIDACLTAGISKDQIIVDPGFGFGKTLEHNYQLLAQLGQLQSLGVPVLSGTSRKSMLGNLLNRDTEQRLAGSIVTAAVAAQNGASILRVHDVKETVDAIKIVQQLGQYH